MTGASSRLQHAEPELFAQINQANDTQLRQIALAVCELAVLESGLSEPVADAAISCLQNKQPASEELFAEIERLVSELDGSYFASVDAAKEAAYEAEPARSFTQARAAGAILFALRADTLFAASEAIYEAISATENADLVRKIVRLILDIPTNN